MHTTNRDGNRRSPPGATIRVTPRRLTWSAIVAEVILAAPRLAWPEFPNPGVLFPLVFWPVMIYLALSWQNHPAAWRAAARAAAPVIIVSWALQALTLLVGR